MVNDSLCAELADGEEDQYNDTLSLPIFLLLSQTIELQLVGQNPLVVGKRGVASLITDDTSLLLVRMIFFSAFPLILSVRLLRHGGMRGEHTDHHAPDRVTSVLKGIDNACRDIQ